jgi:hypothetical protein
MNDAEKGGHNIWISGPELQGFENCQAKKLLISALAYLWDDGYTQLPNVETIPATDEAWKEYVHSSLPKHSHLFPRGTPLHALEPKDIYKLH